MSNKALKTLLLCGVSFYAASFTSGSFCMEINMKADMPLFSQMVKDLSARRMGIQGLLGQKLLGDTHAFGSNLEDQVWPVIDAGVVQLTL